jgi:SPOR domain
MKLMFFACLLTLCSATIFDNTIRHSTARLVEMTDTLNPQLSNGSGDVQLVVDSSITKLEKSMRGFRDIKGFRIQIYLGTAEAVKNERNKYLGLGLPYSAYMKQVVPEYSLVVGDFATRMELEKHLQVIRQHYPKAFAVNDMIEIKAKK